ncbi:23S rRNA (adenine(1618)-N(6))-methyltransferase RlmF [Chitinibacter sp. ZOR0017]|uniref:23S rRNA (adenine(1618)-N(6))-methyltransferase RlmF n=1 Tax=Chitinibacter sp. ZOR0017 TaxID=1339254 RepID=UPI0009DD08C2|nr:23S rRNA (adenine(1618)-N(6))-methyltransferase RlmF [Chitinibacter sp. ZOR0017]
MSRSTTPKPRSRAPLPTRSAPKGQLHPRNPHQGRYDFAALTACLPELAALVRTNPRGEPTIDFADPNAVKTLNRALLALYYGVGEWDIPSGYLCPPIPGRADYIHTLADLLLDSAGKPQRGPTVRVLDVGAGANAIYPLLGRVSYGWSFVGADIDRAALSNAARIFAANPVLADGLATRWQREPKQIFRGVIEPGEYFAFTLCNPPFHRNAAEANAGTARKVRNLGQATAGAAPLNFAGQSNELWCAGGELAFIGRMIEESRQFARQVGWFTTLVAKSEHLPALQRALHGAAEVRVLPMSQGQKVSRLLAWRWPQDKM